MALDAGVANLPPTSPPAGAFVPWLAWDPGELPALRIARTAKGPLYFSPDSSNRFRTPLIPEGELYLGDSASTCFWEVFWDALHARGNARHLPRKHLAERSIYTIMCKREIRLFQAHGGALKQVGASNVSCFNGNYATCRQWAAFLYQLEPKLDGILYPPARGVGMNLVLFGSRVRSADVEISAGGVELLKDTSICELLIREKIYSF